MNIEELKIHFFYLVTILTLALIIVSTGLWTDKENFTVFLTNAATMISIVLGLVAIFYSFISNTSLSQSLGNITTVSNGVEKSNQLVNQFVAQAEQLNKANLQNAERMAALSINVDKKLNSLTNLLNDWDIKSLQASVSVLPTKMDSLEMRILEGANRALQTNNEHNDESEIHYNVANIERTLDSTSVFIMFLIYACQVAYKKKLKLDLAILSPILGLQLIYWMGVMTTFSAVWLFERDWESKNFETYIFTISQMDEQLVSYNVEGHIRKYLSDNSDRLEKETLENFANDFQKVKEYLVSVELTQVKH